MMLYVSQYFHGYEPGSMDKHKEPFFVVRRLFNILQADFCILKHENIFVFLITETPT